MFCTNCGNSVPTGAAFCGQCGQAIASAASPAPAKVAPPAPPAAGYPPPSAVPPMPTAPPPMPPMAGVAPARAVPAPPPMAPPVPVRPAAAPGYPPQYPPPVQAGGYPPPPPPYAPPPQAGYPPPPMMPPPAPGMAVPGMPIAPMGSGPMPPQMHWAVLLILSWITGGIAMLIWAFKQAGFVKKLDPASKALTMLKALTGMVIVEILLYVVVMVSALSAARSRGAVSGMVILAGIVIWLINMAAAVMGIVTVFGMRRSLVQYYNSVEPIGLRLSGVMTFFFSVLYFQYHFTRIGNWKKTGTLV